MDERIKEKRREGERIEWEKEKMDERIKEKMKE
jgi:hypothetical protein